MTKEQEEILWFSLEKTNEAEVFVGYPFSPRFFNKINFKKQIQKALRGSGFQPYFYDDHFDSDFASRKIFSKISNSKFGVFDLSEGNDNILLEIGISIGRNKKIFLLKQKGSDYKVPFDIKSIEIIYYDDLIDLEYKLKPAIREIFPVKKRGEYK